MDIQIKINATHNIHICWHRPHSLEASRTRHRRLAGALAVGGQVGVQAQQPEA